MPLATVLDVVGAGPHEQIALVERYRDGVEANLADRRAVVAYLHARLQGGPPEMYAV